MPCVKRSFCLALGRICPEKGFHIAIRAATKARVPLLLAGEVFGFKAHQDYFNAEIVPKLSPSIRFIGALKFARKMRLLSAARCLLVPSLAGETSSLVAMEALACGTPVIASCVGALPDIIEHGRTGYLVKNADEMAEAIEAVATLDPQVCRATARRRFGMERMIGDYFELYAHLSAVRKRQRDVHQPGLALETIAAPAL
jgi:glycosyltransferase involved in cell wall biosynthesis